MRTGKRRKKSRSINYHHNDAKTRLLTALTPLCNDISWMNSFIDYLSNIDFPNSDFELAGLIRKICYKLQAEHPDFYDKNPALLPLKNLANDSMKSIKVKRCNETFTKMVERIATELKNESISKKASR